MKIYYESKPGELEHGMLSKLFKRKYLKKIPLGNGKYRYIYTQKELEAYNEANAKRRANKVQEREGNIAKKRNNQWFVNNVMQPKVSKEYLEELAYNSKKNKY